MNYNYLLPLVVLLGLGIILITTFTVVDTTLPTTPSTQPPLSCIVSETILTNISGPIVLTNSGYFNYEEFRDYSNSLIVSSLPSFITTYYPIPPTPPIQVTAAVEYLGDLYLTIKDVPVLFSISTGAKGTLGSGSIKGYAVKNGVFYGIINNNNLLKIDSATTTTIVLSESLLSVSINLLTNAVFALKTNGDIVRINLINGALTPTCIVGKNYSSISFDSLGRLWAFRPNSIDRYPTEPNV